MKKSVFIIGALLCNLALFSQNYYPFPTSDAYWNEYKQYQGWCDAPDYCKNTYYTNGDTIIDSLVYTKIYFADDNANGYYGAIREQNKRVYYKHRNSPHPVLLYDFNFNVGDSMIFPRDFCDTSWTYYNVVSSVDSILLPDMSFRKRIKIGGNDWIEGIGSNGGLLYTYYWGYACMCWTNLVCFSHNGVQLYLDESTLPCFNYIVSERELYNTNRRFSSYPNPFTTSTTIEYELKEISNIQYSVYNMQGVVVYEWEENEALPGTHKVIWSPNHLPSGMYYGVLRSEDGVSVVKMIKQ